jgi:hypothetical protein
MSTVKGQCTRLDGDAVGGRPKSWILTEQTEEEKNE